MADTELDWYTEMRLASRKLQAFTQDLRNPTQVDIQRAILRVQQAINGLLAVESRARADSISPAEVSLETAWQKALEPALDDLYWQPFSNGLSSAPDDPEELTAWLRRRLRSGAAITALRDLLDRYSVRGVNIGGKIALDHMEVGGTFRLEDRDYLAEIAAHSETLTTLDSEMSLINTTVDDLVRGIPQARADEDNTLKVMAALIGGWSLSRSAAISVTETSRTVAMGLVWAYLRNDVRTIEFFTIGDELTCVICGPLDGLVVPVNRIPARATIPRHPYCRCRWEGKLDGWETPSHIWRG